VAYNNQFKKKLFKVARELNVSTDRVVEFLREQGYADALSGSGFNASITDEEAYYVLRAEYVDDSEAAARVQELLGQDSNGPERDKADAPDEEDQEDSPPASDTGHLYSEPANNAPAPRGTPDKPDDSEIRQDAQSADSGDRHGHLRHADELLNRIRSEVDQRIDESFDRLLSELKSRIPQIIVFELRRRGLVDESGNASDMTPEQMKGLRSDLLDRVRDLVDHKLSDHRGAPNEKFRQLGKNLDDIGEDLPDMVARQRKELKKHYSEQNQIMKDVEDVSVSDDEEPNESVDTREKLNGQEIEVIEHLKNYISGQGFYYPPETIQNFYTCLKCDPLVILAGLSGVGKSKLPKLVTEAIGGVFQVVPVRPNWNDDRDLLGYFNPRSGRYQSTNFLETIIEASENKRRLYVICLDEMNLAPPEYYFALFLSKLENNKRKFYPDPSLSKQTYKKERKSIISNIIDLKEELRQSGVARIDSLQFKIEALMDRLNELQKYREVEIPSNLRFVGTVNIDHTTKDFSNKVLDRANVIQFDNPNLEAARSQESKSIDPKFLPFDQFDDFASVDGGPLNEDSPLYVYSDYLIKISEMLEGDLGFGYRVYEAILRYLKLVKQGGYNFEEGVDGQASFDKEFDKQLVQRILPKIRGMDTRETKKSLDKLDSYLDETVFNNCDNRTKSQEKLDSMISQLDAKGYVNYWEV